MSEIRDERDRIVDVLSKMKPTDENYKELLHHVKTLEDMVLRRDQHVQNTYESELERQRTIVKESDQAVKDEESRVLGVSREVVFKGLVALSSTLLVLNYERGLNILTSKAFERFKI